MDNTPGIEDILAQLKASPVCALLPPSAQLQFAQAALIERYKNPCLLQPAGKPLLRLRLVLRGYLSLVTGSVSGQESAFVHIGPQGWLSWLACFSTTATSHDTYSSRGGLYLAWPTSVVRELCIEHPVLYPAIINEISKPFRLLMEWSLQSVLLTPVQRMGKLVLLLARAQRSVDGNRAQLASTQAELARLARCSRQSANQLLAELERLGLLSRSYGQFVVPDMDRLILFVDTPT